MIGWWLGVFIFSVLVTAGLRWYALQRNVLDLPNQRSSHKVPTPRGGGMAIVVTFLAGGALLPIWTSGTQQLLVLLAGALVATVGFIDDHVSLAPSRRLLVHALGAALVTYAAGGLPTLDLWGWQFDPSWLGYAVALVGLIWLVNLYNFMDGIDGLAGVEVVSVCLLVWGLHYLGGQTTAGLLPLLLSAAAMGFLLWNWPPARIFMGDGGSGFLGLMLGALMLLDAASEPRMLWVWLVLLGVFVVDATWTLLHRWRLGIKLSEAHRTHAYQYASRAVGSHLPVTLSVLVINLLWLAPIAALIKLEYLDGMAGIALAYAPLCFLARHYKAGKPECC